MEVGRWPSGNFFGDMKKMKKILFPTEFSDHAPEVFRYAVELAYFFNARLLVMHAFGKPEIRLASEEEKVKKTDVVVDKLIDFVHQHIPEEYSSNLKIDYFAYNNYPAEAILKLALDESADLIVIGTTGKKNPMETLLGSTSLEVIAKADCPGLAVPSGAKFEGIYNLVYTSIFENL